MSKKFKVALVGLMMVAMMLVGCDDPRCDVTGPNTQLTSCAYAALTK